VQPVINVMMDGVSNATDYQLQQILGTANYYRVQTTLDVAKDDMDDASDENIRNLVLHSEKLIQACANTLSDVCARLSHQREVDKTPCDRGARLRRLSRRRTALSCSSSCSNPGETCGRNRLEIVELVFGTSSKPSKTVSVDETAQISGP
jgi:hypothetical protein